ncbi:MAG: PilZ domain-containing protein [Lachnospiraceae bacterium]|nr:PilZ domain-containing protein [Lachnospiraceae bacterium]
MLITDIQPGSKIVIIARTPGNQLEFKTTTGDIIADKNMILAELIKQDEKLLTFKGHNVITDIMLPLENANPQVFVNVEINLIKKADGSIWYALRTIAGSKAFNRRASFRCTVGTPTTVQLGLNKQTYDGYMKDVSNTGFGFVCDDTVPIEMDQVIYANLNDYIERLDENFSFRLSGIVVNIVPMEKNRIKVGCRFNKDVPGIDKYIVTKERMRLKNTKGKAGS